MSHELTQDEARARLREIEDDPTHPWNSGHWDPARKREVAEEVLALQRMAEAEQEEPPAMKAEEAEARLAELFQDPESIYWKRQSLPFSERRKAEEEIATLVKATGKAFAPEPPGFAFATDPDSISED